MVAVQGGDPLGILDTLRDDWAAHGPLVTCDPGVQGTGLAFWWDPWTPGAPMFPDFAECIRGRRNLKGRDRMEDVIYRAALWFANLPDAPALFVVELPGLWEGNAVSHAAAAKGDTFGLAYLAGRLAGEASRRSTLGGLPHLWTVSPQEWKGQLPKAVVNLRIDRAWARVNSTGSKVAEDFGDHVSDAVGMGLAVGGWL